MGCLILFLCHFLVFPSGSPLSIVSMPATESALFRMQFVDDGPVSTDDSQTLPEAEVHLLVVCKSGAIHTVTTGRGTQSCTMLLTERLPAWIECIVSTTATTKKIINTCYFLYCYRPKDSGDFPATTASVPFLQSLVGELKLFMKGI